MSCNRYSGCSCNNCAQAVQTTSISVEDGVLILVIPNNNYVNHQMVCISLIATSTPSQTPPIPVKIGLGGTDSLIDVITENGNYLYSDQLYRRSILRVMVATDSVLMIKRGCFNRTSAVFPEPLVANEAVTADTGTAGG